MKRCEAWEEMKEEKSDSPVDEGATRTDTLFLVACVRVPCARLPELTNEKNWKAGNGSGSGTGKSKMQPAKRTERSHPAMDPSRIRPAADDAQRQRRDQSDELANRRTPAPRRNAAQREGRDGDRLRDERMERRGSGPLAPMPAPVPACANQVNILTIDASRHSIRHHSREPIQLTGPFTNPQILPYTVYLTTSRPKPFAFKSLHCLRRRALHTVLVAQVCNRPSIPACCRLIVHPLTDCDWERYHLAAIIW